MRRACAKRRCGQGARPARAVRAHSAAWGLVSADARARDEPIVRPSLFRQLLAHRLTRIALGRTPTHVQAAVGGQLNVGGVGGGEARVWRRGGLIDQFHFLGLERVEPWILVVVVKFDDERHDQCRPHADVDLGHKLVVYHLAVKVLLACLPAPRPHEESAAHARAHGWHGTRHPAGDLALQGAKGVFFPETRMEGERVSHESRLTHAEQLFNRADVARNFMIIDDSARHQPD